MSGIILRNKNANSAFDVKGIKLKSAENKVVDKKEEKIELELNEEVLKKKKVIKK
jgi:hypothetical protein